MNSIEVILKLYGNKRPTDEKLWHYSKRIDTIHMFMQFLRL